VLFSNVFAAIAIMKFFLPQRGRVIADLDRRMRAKLASSLAHIFDRMASTLGIEDSELGPLLAEIMAHRQAPSVFATYFELVFALKASATTRPPVFGDESLPRSARRRCSMSLRSQLRRSAETPSASPGC
jgi:hypothetical protein